MTVCPLPIVLYLPWLFVRHWEKVSRLPWVPFLWTPVGASIMNGLNLL